MALNNQFQQLAEQFCDIYQLDWDDEQRHMEIRKFLNEQGIDPAWMDEAHHVVEDYIECMYD